MKCRDFIKSRHQICINANKKLICHEKYIFPKNLRKLYEFFKRVACRYPKFNSPAQNHDKMTFLQILKTFFKIIFHFILNI